MAPHAEDALRCPRVSQVLDLAFTVSASEAGGAESLVPGEDGEIFDFVATGAATVGAVVADERAVTEEEQVCV